MIRIPLPLPLWHLGCLLAPSQDHLETACISKLVLHLTNRERLQRGLPALRPHWKLDRVAQFHSSNMAASGFFAHEDPHGRSPQQRMTLLYPNLLGGVGENIAVLSRYAQEELARLAVDGWMNSPGHRKNILSDSYSHLGVSLAASRDRIYLTQSFANLYIEFGTAAQSRQLCYGSRCALTFSFLGAFPRADLAIHLEVPDRDAMHAAAHGAYYRGTWPLLLRWRSEQLGEVGFTSVYGRGPYRLFAGRKSSGLSSPVPFIIEVS